jgi:hypothetical protein
MAKLARNYHNKLQTQDICVQSDTEHAHKIEAALEAIPIQQHLEDPDRSLMNQTASEKQVQEALKLTKNNTATRMDGCLYELWKTLNKNHLERSKLNQISFDIGKTLTKVFQDIQEHGIEENTFFALGWMYPIYKKKD